MNKRINFEDTIFILNVRIRMIQDLMQLDTDVKLFYNQTIDDLRFINSVMDMLSEKFLDNLNFLDRDIEADNILNAEWQFTQILNAISNNSSPFSSMTFPEILSIIDDLRKNSAERQKKIEESYVPTEHSLAEPVVSNAELNSLLGSA
jgi:hypothetical protein